MIYNMLLYLKNSQSNQRRTKTAIIDCCLSERCITHPNIENFIFSLFWVETQKLKKIVTNTLFFVMESGKPLYLLL